MKEEGYRVVYPKIQLPLLCQMGLSRPQAKIILSIQTKQFKKVFS